MHQIIIYIIGAAVAAIYSQSVDPATLVIGGTIALTALMTIILVVTVASVIFCWALKLGVLDNSSPWTIASVEHFITTTFGSDDLLIENFIRVGGYAVASIIMMSYVIHVTVPFAPISTETLVGSGIYVVVELIARVTR